jgi:hypothetical protein
LKTVRYFEKPIFDKEIIENLKGERNATNEQNEEFKFMSLHGETR